MKEFNYYFFNITRHWERKKCVTVDVVNINEWNAKQNKNFPTFKVNSHKPGSLVGHVLKRTQYSLSDFDNEETSFSSET